VEGTSFKSGSRPQGSARDSSVTKSTSAALSWAPEGEAEGVMKKVIVVRGWPGRLIERHVSFVLGIRVGLIEPYQGIRQCWSAPFDTWQV